MSLTDPRPLPKAGDVVRDHRGRPALVVAMRGAAVLIELSDGSRQVRPL